MPTAAKRRFSTNQILGFAALGLGVLALAGNPYQGHSVHVDAKELATIVGTEVDHVTPKELADWIIRGATDYRLIDLRRPEEYAQYHIPTAEEVPIARLPDYPLGRNEKIVLYSEGGIHSAQAWFLLKAQRFAGAYILLGGLEGWNDEVLYPTPPLHPSPQEAAAFERTMQVSRFFGGAPRAPTDSTARAANPTLALTPAPPVTRVPAPPVSPVARQKKAKKEGC
jgi:rhodanese-related sulfurtransferase